MNSFATGLSITENIELASTTSNPQTQALIFGTRTTGGDLIQPPSSSSFSIPNLFVPFQLPSFADGVSAVNYLVNNFGYVVNWGVDFSLVLPTPSTATLLTNGNYLFQWNAIPSGFNSLLGGAITGVVTQSVTNTGNIVSSSIQIVNNVAQLAVTPIGISTFNAGSSLSIAGINNIQKPNIQTSDMIVVNVFAFYNQAVTASAGRTNPNAWISVMNDNCTTVNPVSTPIVLGDPASAPVVNPDTSVTLTYPANTAGLGYLPTTMLGESTVIQAVSSATGTYNGYTIDSLGNVDINIIDVTGTFTITDSVSVILDVTQSGFNYIDNYQISTYVLPFQITSLTDLTTTQSTFYNALLVLNNGYAVQQQKFLPQGYYANMTAKSQVLNLQTPNTQIFKGAWKPDQPYTIVGGVQTGSSSLLDYTETPGSIASAMAYIDLSTQIPFPSQSTVTLNLSVNSNSQTYPTTGQSGDCNQGVIQGWTPIAVNANGLPYIWRNVTSIVTVPNTLIVDNQYRYESLWLKQRWLQQQVFIAWTAVSQTPFANGGMQLNSPAIQQQMLTACQSILVQGGQLGMFQNVKSYLGLVTVVIDPTNPTGIDVTIPNQPTPELATAKVAINIFSIYYAFTS